MNTKDKLMAASYELMLLRGYAATTVDEVCAKAQVSKGSFYHFFNTKEDLGLALLDDYIEKSRAGFLSGSFNNENDPLRRMFGFLEQTESSASKLWEHGCLLGNFATELSQTHPAVRERVSRILQELTDNLAEIFTPLRGQRVAGEELDPTNLAEYYLVIIEGAIILSRAHNDWSYLTRGLKSFRNYLEAIVT